MGTCSTSTMCGTTPIPEQHLLVMEPSPVSFPVYIYIYLPLGEEKALVTVSRSLFVVLGVS